jgi:hypothetical protein
VYAYAAAGTPVRDVSGRFPVEAFAARGVFAYFNR